jgi:hypothetical protein
VYSLSALDKPNLEIDNNWTRMFIYLLISPMIGALPDKCQVLGLSNGVVALQHHLLLISMSCQVCKMDISK